MDPNADDRWSARIARARQLASTPSAATDLLTFAAGLAETQRALRGVSEAAGRPATVSLAASLNREVVIAAIPVVIEWAIAHAPHALATAAAVMRDTSRSEWRQRLDAWLDEDAAPGAHVRFVLEATVQPFAEVAAASMVRAGGVPALAATCPFCDRQAALATLREAGHGARRSLRCGLCLTEWAVPRIGCAACGETGFERLPVFTADEARQARIDACDSCHAYLKTIDFTRDGLAVPFVDDLATLPLDLWAQDQGYRRWRPHLFGI